MAIVSSHLLSSTDGSHASGVKVIINQIKKNGSRRKIFQSKTCLLYTSPSPRDVEESRMPSSA